MSNTGDRLKQCRIKRGLSRAEVAEMLHISSDYLARVETGTQPVTFRIIDRINRNTDWNSDYILHGIDSDNPFLETYQICPDKRKKVLIRNILFLFDSMLQFGYKDERKVGYYHRMILEIVNGMELDVPDNVRIGYTLTELRRILDMDRHMMAQVIGVSDRSFCALENGLSKPDIRVLQIIYTMYGFNTKYFISRNPLECEAVSNIYRGFDEPLREFIMRRIRDDYDEIIIMRGRTYGRDI
ncbi:MAG: transcriptional regulator [Eubacteriales bacterium]|nr:transcriptional regulator [Eubacteriales bacterium]